MKTQIFTARLKEPPKTWPIDCDGYFREQISNQLAKDDIPAESIDQIFENAVEILSQCPNPQSHDKQQKTGIMIGKVQSGKTSNFIALTALAFDNNYDITIVLGGNKTNLLDQNASRIESYYTGVPKDKLVVLTTNKNAKLLEAQTIRNFILAGRKVIIVGLKHQKHINQIAEIFENSPLSNHPTLIIDDEGDQATPNTKRNKQTDMSAIYGAVISLKEKLRRHCFISITATPQANILIETWDALSPDFGVLIYPGDNYCGLAEFHGKDEEVYIKSIPDDDPDILNDPGVPQSFYDALSVFFVGGALRKYRGDNKNHAMLIHPSQKTYDHELVMDKVSHVMRSWLSMARDIKNGVVDIAFEPFMEQLMRGYDSLQNDGVSLPDFPELKPYIIACIIDCSPPLLCNSNEDASANSAYYNLNIVVGGNMVERGITIKGLAVTYIIRRAKGKANVDNAEQRARWFGYKKDYLDVCRVYTTDVIRDDFKAIYEHDEDLWSSIERAQRKGIAFKNLPRIFILASKRLNLTRSNVGKADRFAYSEWSRQDYLMLDKASSKHNDDVIEAFKNGYLSELSDYSKFPQHSIIRGLDYTVVNEVLLQKVFYPSKCKFDQTFFEKLALALKKVNIVPIIDVVFITKGVARSRSLYDDDRINQLFEGRNAHYPGDAGIAQDSVMQLQIHKIIPKNRSGVDFASTAFALYIPSEYSEKIEKLVGKKV